MFSLVVTANPRTALFMKWYFIDSVDEKYFKHYDMHKLDIDEFYITFRNYLTSDDTYLYTLQKDCVECPYLINARLSIKNKSPVGPATSTHQYSTNLKFRVASGYPRKYLPFDETGSVVCDVDRNFGQFGVYNVDITQAGCHINTLKEPVNIFTPMVTVLLIYPVLSVIIYGIISTWKNDNKKCQKMEKTFPGKVRTQSLDTFRGITIVLMIFVNYGCGDYRLLKHSAWNGLHLADVVFPFFVWIMGVCIPMSLTSNFNKGVLSKTILLNIIKRSVKLFCLGLFICSRRYSNYLRIFGVLQRLSISYLVVATICLFCMDRPSVRKKNKKLKKWEDILNLRKCWTAAIGILLLHTIITFCVAKPGCPRGYLGPGGLHKNHSYKECVGGATGYVDELILSTHIPAYLSIKTYMSAPFEHAGIVGSLTTIFHVFIGVQAGVILLTYKNHLQRIVRWILWAIVYGLVGGILCGFSTEGGLIPMNWNLWSLSFLMVTASLAFISFSVCYIIVDVKRIWCGKPFLFVGRNAICLYIFHQMVDGYFPVRWYLGHVSRRTHFGALFSDLWGTGVSVIVSYYLYKNNYFFSV